MKINLSVVLATRNEEKNIERCLASVAGIADEIVIYDEHSADNTRKIAEQFGAKVFLEPHHDNFHITKQKAIDKARGEWILQLDADEVVTPELAKEISEVIKMSSEQILARRPADSRKWKLFQRHTKLMEKNNRLPLQSTAKNSVSAFFIPRKNMFVGKALVYSGVYPDPAIRLIKRGEAWLPAKSVHEIMHTEGKVAWLFSDMLHYDSPTYSRYIERLNRYTDLHAGQLAQKQLPKNYLYIFIYSTLKPVAAFFNMYFRHKGFKDGLHGFVWSASSAWHYPIAYFKYFTK